METVERKDADTGLEEPIKSEVLAPSSDTNERSNNTASPPPNCSICLEKLINTSFTDSCLHQFCFTCLLQWSKIKTECPLCKQTFKSIIHNVRSEEDYDQYHVQYTSQVAATLDVTADILISGQWNVGVVPVEVGVPVRPFMYRTTMGANRRYGTLLNPEAVQRREQIPSTAPQISHEERRQRNLNPIDYRRTVYRHGVWAALLPDAFGRFRECSAEYYRQHPTEVDRLVPWLNRELQVLLNNNRPHIAYVLTIITEAITQHDIGSLAFLNIVRPFFGTHADHFIHELLNYARTNFDLVGYDQSVSYIPRRGLSNEYLSRIDSPPFTSSSSSSSDSDVRVLNDFLHSHRNNSLNMPSVGPHVVDVAGSSTVGQPSRIPFPYYTGHTDVLTISSTSSSSENECEVIGYVKPRHEKTPEIIDISSSEGEVNTTSQATSNDNIQSETLIPIKEQNLPSTSSSGTHNSRRTRRRTEDAVTAQMYKYLSTTSESDSEETDSDYNPRNTKSRYHKSTTKKSSKTVLRKSRTSKRKKSIGTRKKSKETRTRSPSYSCSSDNENSPRQATSHSRGIKRYLSKSSDDTGPEKTKKKNKKCKKTKSSKKDKKRHVTSSSSSKASRRNYSSSSSSDSNSECEVKNKNSRRRTKKSSSTLNTYDYYSEMEPSTSTKSSSKSSSTRSTSERRTTNKFSAPYLSTYRSASSTPSSTDSLESQKNQERLQDVENDSRQDSDDNTKENERSRSCCSSSTFYDETSSYLKQKENSKLTENTQTRSQSYDRLSSTTSTSGSSSKSNTSSLNERSASQKLRKTRRRSHKKHKESKKRRRSYS